MEPIELDFFLNSLNDVYGNNLQINFYDILKENIKENNIDNLKVFLNKIDFGKNNPDIYPLFIYAKKCNNKDALALFGKIFYPFLVEEINNYEHDFIGKFLECCSEDDYWEVIEFILKYKNLIPVLENKNIRHRMFIIILRNNCKKNYEIAKKYLEEPQFNNY